MTHPSQSLDVATDTQEELNDWVAKIREVTQNADARVSPRGVSAAGSCAYLSKPQYG